MDKKFIAKLSGFITCSIIAPIIYISCRFGLLKSKVSVSFWAIFCLCICLLVVSFLIKYYIQSLKTKYSLLKKLLNGFVRVILPILLLLIVSLWIRSKGEWLLEQIDLVIEGLSVILGFEIIAVCINPLPKWAFDNNLEGLENIFDNMWKRTQKEGE